MALTGTRAAWPPEQGGGPREPSLFYSVVTGCAHSTIRPAMMQRAFRYGPLAEEHQPGASMRIGAFVRCDLSEPERCGSQSSSAVLPLANKSEERPKGVRTNTYVGA
jgi:hypothetical protein